MNARAPSHYADSHIAVRPRCRFCATPLARNFVDLGLSPLCETYIPREDLNKMERFFPLHVWVCESCFLVQLEQYVSPDEIYTDYPYFSSYSDSWVEHARRYTVEMIARFGLGPQSKVMEIASNDGYLLQHFLAAGIPCRGIEPAANVAQVAMERGIPTVVEFLGVRTARSIVERYGRPDLLLGNNVLAHVPDINDFIGGMKLLLGDRGVITMEFPHLQRLMEENQFDTIYHEHFSYLSFSAVQRMFKAHGLVLFDVQELPTHGGSLRIFARHTEDDAKPVEPSVRALRQREMAFGMDAPDTYSAFERRVHETKWKLLEFLIEARRSGKRIAGYGAPGKGNTLLNYCGIRTDLLEFTVDRNPVKHFRFTPGTRIPILPLETLKERRPDYVLILPWNLKDEIVEQHGYVREWGGAFVAPIPAPQLLPF